MNSTRYLLRSVATLGSLFGWTAATSSAQSLYSLQKIQRFVQTASTGVVADPNRAFEFQASAATAATLTLPSGSAQPLTKRFADDSEFSFEKPFSTKAALDAAFPSGTYRLTGTGVPSLSLNLPADAYASVTPQVTNGTWNAGGLLVVNPAQATTITINTFTGYAAAGAMSLMSIEIFGRNDNVSLRTQALNAANPFGLPVATAPITAITIPAGTLTNGRVYEGSVEFTTITTFDATSIPGSGAGVLFSKSLRFFIAAQSAGALLPPPVFSTQPSAVVSVLGSTATFSFNLVNTAPTQPLNIVQEWYFNGQEITIDGSKYAFSQNSNGITVRNLTAADVGNYSVRVITPGGIISSSSAALTLAVPVAPAITAQPSAKNVGNGSTVVFSVEATGTPSPFYQWRKDGVPLINGALGVAGATNATLIITGANSTAAGNYSVSVVNSGGTLTSASAALTVTTTNDLGRLTNLSVLTDITSTTTSFTVGTVVGGTGTNGNKALVVRAVGPSLGAFGVPGTIPDPKLELFFGQKVVATNDNWNGDSALADRMASVGAFPFTGPASKDAAIFQSNLEPGSYTVVTSGVNGSAGTAIAEIYDATSAAAFTPASSRLINVSVLKPIEAGGSLTLGFYLSGAVAKTVLIRAIGPGLAAVGVTSGTLSDPQLTLFNSSSSPIAKNDDWGADALLTNASSRVGAFNIGNASSKDAMLLITLPAGGYTARVVGGGTSSGLVIVEAYEVP
ncbi:MAG: hypothetical protein RL077_1179 [Verrucomicrobiota bacterium]